MSLRSRLSSALGALLGEPVPSHDLAKALDEQRALTEFERTTRRRYSLHLDDIRCDLADAGIAIPEDDDPETTPRRMVQALIEERAVPSDARATWHAWQAEVGQLREETEAAHHETGDLREAVTEAIGLAWHPIPQPLGATAYVCPDDREIVAACAALRAGVRPTEPAPEVPEARVVAILKGAEGGVEHGGGPLTALEIAHVITGLSFLRIAFVGVTETSIARIVSSVAREGWLADDGKKPRRYTLTEKGRAALADSARVAS
jgi:hypothetical protein